MSDGTPLTARACRALHFRVQNFPMILLSMIKVSDRQSRTLSVSAGTAWVLVGSFWVTHPVALEGERKKHPADRETSPLQQQHKLQSTFLTVDRPVSVFGCKLLHPGGCVAPTNTDHHRGAREGRGKEVKGKKQREVLLKSE